MGLREAVLAAVKSAEPQDIFLGQLLADCINAFDRAVTSSQPTPHPGSIHLNLLNTLQTPPPLEVWVIGFWLNNEGKISETDKVRLTVGGLWEKASYVSGPRPDFWMRRH